MTRGQHESLLLCRQGLAPFAPCRSPGAHPHVGFNYGLAIGPATVAWMEPYSGGQGYCTSASAKVYGH